MQWEVVLAMVLAAPVIFIPAALIWSINFFGMRHAIRDAMKWMEGVTRAASRG